MIYTPQMIVNGQEDVVGAHAMELADLINKHKTAPSKVQVRATRSGDTVVVRVETASGVADIAGSYDVHLVRITPMKTANITRGELAGKSLDYANIVDGWSVLGQWDGHSAIELNHQVNGDRPTAILVQKAGYGAILAAAWAN